MDLNNFIDFQLPILIDKFELFSYLVFFLISAIESMPIIGFLIPGGSIVIASGVFSQMGYLNLPILLLIVSTGAIIGDYIGYFLGTKGINYFSHEARWLKLSHLEKSEKFFKKHGNKSIFLGRFIAPLRSMVPFIAGLSKMDKKTFLFYNVLSGFSWALINILFGYFVGKSLDLNRKQINELLILILLIIVFSILKYFWTRAKNKHNL